MNRDALKRKIVALRQKTVARGCTEAEALAAAEMAAALMREYGLTDGDVVMDEQTVLSRTKGHSPRDRLWNTLAFCTNTAAMLHDGAQTTRVFIGEEPGPSIAAYLYVVLDRSLDREIAAFKDGPLYRRRRTAATKRQAVSDFTVGLVRRLQERLRILFAETLSDEAFRRAVEARDVRHPDAQSVTPRAAKDVRFAEAWASGRAAGDGVNLAHGLGGRSEIKQIGGAA